MDYAQTGLPPDERIERAFALLQPHFTTAQGFRLLDINGVLGTSRILNKYVGAAGTPAIGAWLVFNYLCETAESESEVDPLWMQKREAFDPETTQVVDSLIALTRIEDAKKFERALAESPAHVKQVFLAQTISALSDIPAFDSGRITMGDSEANAAMCAEILEQTACMARGTKGAHPGLEQALHEYETAARACLQMKSPTHHTIQGPYLA